MCTGEGLLGLSRVLTVDQAYDVDQLRKIHQMNHLKNNLRIK